MKKDFSEGEVILIDKPLEWTSFDVVKKLRNNLKIKKIGHAGTLDPLATGLLILCTGKFTKKINEYQNMTKEYTGTLLLGKTTPSVDLETAFDSEKDVSHIKIEDIKAATNQFIGTIQQIPPHYSAIKIGGERVYKKARMGEEVVIEPREVTIQNFEITSCNLPEVSFRVVCSKGTYIRSLVRDLGAALQTGACLIALRRTKIGAFDVDDADDINTFILNNKEKASIKT